MSKEGVDVSFRIHPITAVAIALILVAGGASAGWIVRAAHESAQRIPFLNTILPSLPPQATPTPTPDPWKDAAYTGVLRKVQDGKYYLQMGDGQAITLSVSVAVNLEKYVGKKILAAGRFNKQEEVLYVTDAADLEYVIQAVAIPTIAPTQETTPIPEPTL